MKRFIGCWPVLIGFCTFFAAHAVAAAAASPALHGDEFAETVRLYSADRGSIERFYDLPWSKTRFDRLAELSRAWQQRLRDADFEALNQAGRIDYLLLRNELASEIDRGTLNRHRLDEMNELLSFREVIQDFERARWRMEPLDPQSAASRITEVAAAVKKLRDRVEQGKKHKEKPDGGDEKDGARKEAEAAEASPLKISAPLARRAAAAVNDIRGTLKTWYGFYDGYQPEFSWWLKKPYDEASAALESYAKYLREEVAGLKGKDEDPLIGDPIGRDALLRDIAGEMLPYTPEEIIAIGEKEFAWCEAEMKKAAREMKQEDWRKALAEVKTHFVPPGKQDELVAQFAREAIDFVKQRDLVTITPLCEEMWRVSMISPEGQKSMPYVAYGGQKMLVAYAKEEMKHEDKLMAMRGNNRHFTRITTAHELMPGHHLQIFTGERNRGYRSIFSTPFLTEGWALYWELRLWDLGYGQTPEDRIGMLFWRMHRAARIIVSLKFHLGQMQPREMVDFLVDRVGHERFGATSEVRRFIGGDYSPLYQCGYMIGGLQLRALHDEVVGGGRMSEREFNDTVLTYNSIPVELIRAGLLNLPLTRETKSTWKFAGDLSKH